MAKFKSQPLTNSRFSEFIRNASPQEKARVYAAVMDRVAERQAEMLARYAALQAASKPAVD
jgi:hypothetical protein